jgi:hypothetical protein
MGRVKRKAGNRESFLGGGKNPGKVKRSTPESDIVVEPGETGSRPGGRQPGEQRSEPMKTETDPRATYLPMLKSAAASLEWMLREHRAYADYRHLTKDEHQHLATATHDLSCLLREIRNIEQGPFPGC